MCIMYKDPADCDKAPCGPHCRIWADMGDDDDMTPFPEEYPFADDDCFIGLRIPEIDPFDESLLPEE